MLAVDLFLICRGRATRFWLRLSVPAIDVLDFVILYFEIQTSLLKFEVRGMLKMHKEVEGKLLLY